MALQTPIAPRPRPPEDFCLPREYRQRDANLTLDANREGESYWSDWRVAESGKWQHHVYAWAGRLIRERGVSRVLDLGCGAGTKTGRHLVPVAREVVGVDQASALAIARTRVPHAEFHEIDLEQPELPAMEGFDLVVCADVVEHLVDPDPMLAFVARVSRPGALLLISTPERDRERGRSCRAAEKPEHVREWSRSEFRAFLASRGLRPVRSRLFPKDDADAALGRQAEVEFRMGRRERSPWCCQAWLGGVNP